MKIQQMIDLLSAIKVSHPDIDVFVRDECLDIDCVITAISIVIPYNKDNRVLIHSDRTWFPPNGTLSGRKYKLIELDPEEKG